MKIEGDKKVKELKISIALLTFFIFLSPLCIAVILVDDSFEDYEVGKNPPAPWEPLVRNADDGGLFQVDDTVVFEGTKSLHMVDTPSDWSSFGAKFESNARTITYELRAYTELDDLRTMIMIMSSDNIQADADDGKANYVAFMGSGFIEYHDGAWHPVTDYKVKTWHRIACEVNLDAQTYALYVDDMTKPVVEAAAFWHPVEKLSYAIIRGSPQGGPYWVDNIFVYEGKVGEESKAVEPVGKMTTTWGVIKRQY